MTSFATVELFAITVASRLLKTEPARDVVILTDSRLAVLRLDRPAASNPATLLVLRIAAMLVKRHQNISP